MVGYLEHFLAIIRDKYWKFKKIRHIHPEKK